MYKFLHKIQEMKHNRLYSKHRLTQLLKKPLKGCVFFKKESDGQGLGNT